MFRSVLLCGLAASASAFQAPVAFRAPTSRASPARVPVSPVFGGPRRPQLARLSGQEDGDGYGDPAVGGRTGRRSCVLLLEKGVEMSDVSVDGILQRGRCPGGLDLGRRSRRCLCAWWDKSMRLCVGASCWKGDPQRILFYCVDSNSVAVLPHSQPGSGTVGLVDPLVRLTGLGDRCGLGQAQSAHFI